MSLKNKTGVIRTHMGVMFDVRNPQPEQIFIEDIVHALSNQCRFGGHTSVFYSVAEHCIRCKLMAHEQANMPPKLSKQQKADSMMSALLHDASEAYLVDIPTPVKILLPDYYKIEHKLMQAIAEKFGFTFPLTTQVQHIDEIMLQREWENVVLRKGWPVLSRNAASELFMREFNAIEKYRNNEVIAI